MKPRSRRTRKSNPLPEVSVLTDEDNNSTKVTSKSNICEGVQCEMGTEIFRKFSTTAGVRVNEIDPLDTTVADPLGGVTDNSDPLGLIEVGESASNVKRKGGDTFESTNKRNSNLSSNWSSTSDQANVVNNKTISTCNPVSLDALASGLTLASNGAGSVVIPVILNVVDGNNEIVAVVSLAPNNSNNVVEKDETSSNVIAPAISEPTSSEAQTRMLKEEPERAFTCGDCGAVFTNVCLFGKHCIEHNSVEPYKCTKCTRRFRRRQDMDRHMSSHKGTWYACGLCEKKINDYNVFVAHYKSHGDVLNPPHPNEVSISQLSGEVAILSNAPEEGSFANLSEVQILPTSGEETDKVESSAEETFKCRHCEKGFNDADLLQHHEFTHVEGELYPCDQCGRTFREESRLGMHLRLHKKNQRCEKCDEIFTNMFDFNEHMITHKHENSKEIYMCVHCKVNFKSFHFLKKHARRFHGMEVHWCGDCGGSGHLDDEIRHMTILVGDEKFSKELMDEDPLKIEEDDEMSNAIEDQLEIEVQVDEVVIKDEESSHSENEDDPSECTVTKNKIDGGKRKRLGISGGELVEPQQKSARND